VKILARDRKIPRPLRWLAVFGLLPVPGPFDEAVLLLVAGLLFAFYQTGCVKLGERQSSLPGSPRAGALGLPDPEQAPAHG
jgi:hypothetical protein